MRRILFTLAAIAIAAPAFALSLDAAKAQGLVGERPDGYLGPVQSSSEVVALVKEINNKRRAEYERIAGSSGTTRQAVEALAAQKAYENTPSGQYVQGANGQWMKK